MRCELSLLLRLPAALKEAVLASALREIELASGAEVAPAP